MIKRIARIEDPMTKGGHEKLSAPSIILLTTGIIWLLLDTSYPRKYFACDKPITKAEAVVNPDITA